MATSAGQPFEYPQPFKLPRTGTKARHIIDACIEEMELLGWRAGDLETWGAVTSVRFVFYRLEARGVIPKAYAGPRQPHQDVSEALTTLRYQAVFPLDSIVDETSSQEDYGGAATMLGGALDAVGRVRVNPWPVVPELWVESLSLAGVLRGVAYRYRIPLVPMTGQASVGLLADVAARIAANPPAVVWYLGDFDLSGLDIERSSWERVEAFSRVELNVERLAITREQIDARSLPVMSKYDKRRKAHFEAVETEALGQRMIAEIVTDAIREYWRETVEWPSVEAVERYERDERAELQETLRL